MPSQALLKIGNPLPLLSHITPGTRIMHRLDVGEAVLALEVMFIQECLSEVRELVRSYSPGETPNVVILANEEVLAILPIHGALLENLESCLMLAEDFRVFHAFERKWARDYLVQDKVQHVLYEVAEEMLQGHDLSGTVHVYLNGNFHRRFYAPVGLRDEQDALVPLSSSPQRDHNLKTRRLLELFGPQSVQNLWLLPYPGERAFTCYQRSQNIVGIGRGCHAEDMRRGAIYEYLERLTASGCPEQRVVATYSELMPLALHPTELWGCPQEQAAIFFPGFSSDHEYEWIPAIDAVSERKAYIPLQMVNYRSRREPFFHYATNSSGCALGNSFEEAAFHGALEVIERDALLATWYTRSRPPLIVLDEGTKSPIRELAYLIRALGYELDFFNITSDFEIPVVMAVAYGQGAGQLAAFVTAACNPDPYQALYAAADELHSLVVLCESNFNRKGLSYEAFQRESALDQRESQYFQYAYRENLQHFDFLRGDGPQVAEAQFISAYDYAARSVRDGFQQLRSQIERRGYSMLVASNSPPYLKAIGIESVKVFIPQTFPLIFGPGPIPSSRRRLQDIASKVRWFQTREIPLFPQLHPLG